jgi:hypothetical protein
MTSYSVAICCTEDENCDSNLTMLRKSISNTLRMKHMLLIEGIKIVLPQ